MAEAVAAGVAVGTPVGGAIAEACSRDAVVRAAVWAAAAVELRVAEASLAAAVACLRVLGVNEPAEPGRPTLRAMGWPQLSSAHSVFSRADDTCFCRLHLHTVC